MASESSSAAELELGHVLFMDIVGYSKLLVDEQSDLTRELNRIVRDTEQVRSAEANGKLIRLPTGDGMALVFFTSPEAPMNCALEISRALKRHPAIKLRMGLHSGPVNPVSDVNERQNVAGGGINLAQRVMDCGDAGHILLSKRLAEDLAQYARWRDHLHELGQLEVKHGAKLDIVSFYNDEVGNANLPEKFKEAAKASRLEVKRRRKQMIFGGVILVALASGVLLWAFFHRSSLRAVSASDKSIAVLPFENLSDEKQNAYFADGVQDEILTDLARVAELKVISRTSVMPYKAGTARNLREIGQQLGVANVVEGTVQRSGNRVRVNAQLIDARTDKQLWGQVYDRDLADVFAIQSEIARTIADQLQAKLSPNEKNAIERPPTTDIAAFDLYTRAKNILVEKSLQTKAELLEAIDLLNQAVARDPSFIDAYCQLAYVHDWLYFGGYDHTPARLALAEAAIQAAARLNPNAGETHLARAQNLYWGYRDYSGALAELEIARQTLPNDFRVPLLMATIQRRRGQWEESTRSYEQAVEVNPRNIETRMGIAINYLFLRRYADVRSALANALAVFPNDLDTRVWPAYVEFQEKADTRPLHQMLDSIRATNPTPTLAIAKFWLACTLAERDAAAAKNPLGAFSENTNLWGEIEFSRPLLEGILARMTKDEGKARSAFVAARAEQQKVVQAQPNDGEAVGLLGLIDAGLGRKEEALREGRRAVELLPVEKDAIDGIALVANLAMIAAWVGDKDVAFEQLDKSIRRPSPLSYGGLKLFPWWDPLRGDPRFEKIVEESKQPVALK
jgi:TolB-like protein/Flp pilus assembly protein TadD